MSGGYFNYDQHRIGNIADTIEEIINTNNSKEKNGFGYEIGRHYKRKPLMNLKMDWPF